MYMFNAVHVLRILDPGASLLGAISALPPFPQLAQYPLALPFPCYSVSMFPIIARALRDLE